MCWGSMLSRRLKGILQCTLTHAHTASAGCLPLNLLNARFRCVSLYSRVGAVWLSWLDFIVIWSQRRSDYLQMLLWCMKESMWELCRHVRHMLFYHVNPFVCSEKKDMNHLLWDFCQWCFHLTLSFCATSRCTVHLTLRRSLESAASHLKNQDWSSKSLFESFFCSFLKM